VETAVVFLSVALALSVLDNAILAGSAPCRWRRAFSLKERLDPHGGANRMAERFPQASGTVKAVSTAAV
jgi:hypothetical protein